MTEPVKYVAFENLHLRAKIGPTGAILGFVDTHGDDVMLAVADADGKIGSADGTLFAPGAPAAPTNVNLPEIDGGAAAVTVDIESTVTDGTDSVDWDYGYYDRSAFSYQWKADGVEIDGATANAYTPVLDDLGKELSVVISMTSAGGSVSAESPGVPVNEVPVNSVVPVITGTGVWGTLHSASTGTWSGLENVYTYQWNIDAAPIALATEQTYTPLEAQLAGDLTVTVTATNPSGTDDAESVGTTVIAP
jgi:hypothetical protein